MTATNGRRFIYAVLVSLLAAGGVMLVLPYLQGSAVQTMAVTSLACFLCVLYGRFVLDSRSSERENKQLLQNELPQIDEQELLKRQALENLIAEFFPITVRQIESARGLTEESIKGLSDCFSSLIVRIDNTVNSSTGRAATDDALSSLLHSSEQSLGSVVNNLDEVVKANVPMLEKVRQLNDYTEELKSMANEVATIASQTNLLALNASIEAARAGNAGRGFAVVAGEVRDLSIMSGKTGERISEKVERISEAITSTLSVAEKASSEKDKLVETSEVTIEKVLAEIRSAFDAMSESNSMLKEESKSIMTDISNILVDLQFQDRTSQVLRQVMDSLDYMNQRIQQQKSGEMIDGDVVLNVDRELNAIRKGYTTIEQRKNHHSETAVKAGSEGDDEDMVFF